MTKKIIFLILIFFSIKGYSQSISEYKTFYAGLGLGYTTFQDIKYSKVHYGGVSTNVSLGFEKSKKFLWGFNINYNSSTEEASTYTVGKASTINVNIGTKFLIPIIKNENHILHIGAAWDIFDFYYRDVENLNNNSKNYISNSNIKLTTNYIRKITDDLKIQGGLDFQLFGFVKESTSFGFSAPQNALEEGEFSYQNEDLDNPFVFDYYKAKSFLDYFNMGISLKLHYKKRWALAYNWNMQRSNMVKDYPLTKGTNSLSVIFKIINK